MRSATTILLATVLAMGCRPAGDSPTSGRRTLRVPGDARSVQAAINAARDGDVVLVAPGVYPGGIKLAGAFRDDLALVKSGSSPETGRDVYDGVVGYAMA